jgi:sortase (surface protein transpeptidase)
MSGRRLGLILLALVIAMAGVVVLGVAVSAQRSAPQPPRSVGRIGSGSESSSSPSPGLTPSTGRAPLGASAPVSISIPSIGVHSRVLPIGLAADGTLAVPQPGPNLDRAAWFKNSPTPGQPGPSIIEGHVDSEKGPSVFFELGKMHPGNRIEVTRADGVVAVFTVNAVRDYPKSAFPTRLVYGSPDLGRPELRLITCSDFNSSIGHHTGNEVVFAHLTTTHPA